MTTQTVSLLNDREFFRIVTEGIHDVIVLADEEGRISFISPSVETVLGFQPSERLGRNVNELVHEQDRARFVTSLRALVGGRTLPADAFRFRHKDGSWRTIDVQARNLLGDSRVAALVFNGHDVTVENRMRTELGQLNRLTALGRLSAQVAHEFNNLLMGFHVSIESLRRRTAGEHQLSAICDRMASAIGRGKCITRDILRFARPAQIARERIDVQAFVRQAADEIRPQLPAGIEVVCDVGDEPLFITGDPGQLSQVFTNLALNARDAMQKGGGTLTIGARLGSIHTAASIIDMPDADRFVHFNVTDTGGGIAREDLPYIFEPLFTTKKAGTGLGLAVVQQVVAAHDGHVFLESEKHRGTSVHLFLPAAAASHDEASPALPRAATSAWQIRVLIVEDEAAIAEGLSMSLEEQGMQTRVAGSAADVMPAVASFRPDVVILDLSLPDGDVMPLYERIAAQSVPVILSTGSDVDAPNGAPILRKPYTTDELLRMMRFVLRLDEGE